MSPQFAVIDPTRQSGSADKYNHVMIVNGFSENVSANTSVQQSQFTSYFPVIESRKNDDIYFAGQECRAGLKDGNFVYVIYCPR